MYFLYSQERINVDDWSGSYSKNGFKIDRPKDFIWLRTGFQESIEIQSMSMRDGESSIIKNFIVYTGHPELFQKIKIIK